MKPYTFKSSGVSLAIRNGKLIPNVLILNNCKDLLNFEFLDIISYKYVVESIVWNVWTSCD